MARNTVIVERRFVPEGQVILKEGDVADCAYIIQSGRVKIFMDKKGKEVELAKLEPGDIFGEAALMFDEPRMASAKAIENCNLIIINRVMLDEKLRDSDATIRAIIKMMKQRLETANTIRVAKTATGVEDVHKMFNDAFRMVMHHLPEAERKNYQHEASPILREFLDLTQIYIERKSAAK